MFVTVGLTLGTRAVVRLTAIRSVEAPISLDSAHKREDLFAEGGGGGPQVRHVRHRDHRVRCWQSERHH